MASLTIVDAAVTILVSRLLLLFLLLLHLHPLLRGNYFKHPNAQKRVASMYQ